MKRIVSAAFGLTLSTLPMPSAGAVAIISSEGVEGGYSRDEYVAAADDKEFLVEVQGVPFSGVTQQTFDEALTRVPYLSPCTR